MYLLGVMFPKFFVILRETLQKFWGRKFHHFRGDVTCPKSLRKWDFVKHKKFCLSPCGWTMRWVPDSSIIYYTVVYFSEKNIKKIFTSQDDVRSKLVPRCLKMQDRFVVEVVPSHAIQVLHIFIEDLQARSPFGWFFLIQNILWLLWHHVTLKWVDCCWLVLFFHEFWLHVSSKKRFLNESGGKDVL